MDEFISREATIKRIKEVYCVGCNSYHGVRCRACGTGDAIDIIEDALIADVAPVVHGWWEEMHYEGGILDGTNFDRCSVCGYERVFDDPALKTAFNYCPNCGAKMDGGNSDEAD